MANKSLDGTIRFRKVEESEAFSGDALINLMEKTYLKSRRPDEFKTKKSFAPSSIGYGHAVCPRYWYLAFDGVEFVETTEARNIAIMQTGTDAHARLQGILKEAGILIAEEVELTYKNPPIRGFMDALIKWNGEAVVGEIKTTGTDAFQHKRLKRKPSPNHLLQILIYMKITGKKKGFILYENRDDLSLVVIEIDWNEKNEAILDKALEWMRLVYENWENQTLPVRPYRSQTVKICQNCPLNKACWEDKPEGVVKIEKMEVPTP